MRIGPDWRMVVVGSPAYFAAHGKPQTLHDLQHHHCINLRLPTMDGLYAWAFSLHGHEIKAKVDGLLIFNRLPSRSDAAICGPGLAYVPEEARS